MFGFWAVECRDTKMRLLLSYVQGLLMSRGKTLNDALADVVSDNEVLLLLLQVRGFCIKIWLRRVVVVVQQN